MEFVADCEMFPRVESLPGSKNWICRRRTLFQEHTEYSPLLG